MYLSQLILNPRSQDARRDVAVPYELHRTLARTKADGETRMLFRIEPASGAPGPVVLVQTADAPPDFARLPDAYALTIRGPREFSPQLYEGRPYAFRLVANPTSVISREGRKHRLGLTSASADEDGPPTYWDWLHRKAAECGFEVREARDIIFELGSPRREGAITKQQIPHRGVRFDGILSVTNSARMAEALARGIGRAKAFGFGLLTLAVPR